MCNTHAFFGGVDFSGAKGPLSNLWSAIGVEREGRLHILRLQPHPFRWDLAEYLLHGWRTSLSASPTDRLLCGLDFPLGIPREAVRTVLDDQGGLATWPEINAWLAERSPDQVIEKFSKERKTPRTCDKALALSPLDQRLYKQTVHGARWLHELTCGYRADDLADEAGGKVSILPHAPHAEAGLTLIEVYPSISRNDLGIKAGRKPKRPGEIRSRHASLSSYLTFDHPSMEAAALGLEDAWDATLACLTTYLVREDLDQPGRIGHVDKQTAQTEGWIYRHPQAWT